MGQFGNKKKYYEKSLPGNECLLGLSQVKKKGWSPSVVSILHSLYTEKIRYSFSHANDSIKQISQSSQNGQDPSPVCVLFK